MKRRLRFDSSSVGVYKAPTYSHKNPFEQHFLQKLQYFTERTTQTRSLLPTASLGGETEEYAELLEVVQKLTPNGVIKNLRLIDRLPDEPPLFKGANDISGGAHFFNPLNALWATVAESLERDIWRKEVDYFKNPHTRTYGDSLKNPKKYISIDSFAGFTQKQKQHFPLPLKLESSFLWVDAILHNENRVVSIPAQIPSANYYRNNVVVRPTEPMIRAAVTTGLATGRSQEEALVRGFLEVIERDAFMISYLNELPLKKLDLDALASEDAEISYVLESFKRYRLNINALLPVTDFGIPIILAVVTDPTNKGPAVSIGAKASFSVKEAVLGAFSEALNVYTSSRTRMSRRLPKEEEFDRDDRVINWALPKGSALIKPFLSGKTVKNVPYSEEASALQNESWSAKLEYIVEQCRKKKYQALSVDLSSSHKNTTNLSVVFAVIPELQPMHLHEKFPAFGGERITSVPPLWGFKARAGGILKEPHPFP